MMTPALVYAAAEKVIPREHILCDGGCITVQLKKQPDTLTGFTLDILRNGMRVNDFTLSEIAEVQAALLKLTANYRVAILKAEQEDREFSVGGAVPF